MKMTVAIALVNLVLLGCVPTPEPTDASQNAYSRGNAYRDHGDLQSAITEYDQAVERRKYHDTAEMWELKDID